MIWFIAEIKIEKKEPDLQGETQDFGIDNFFFKGYYFPPETQSQRNMYKLTRG